MSCHFVRESMSSYLDNRLIEPDRLRVARHLADCRECATEQVRLARLRESVRSLPTVPVPGRLAAKLQVQASKAIVYRRRTSSLSARMKYWGESARLVIDNLMRPFALPFAGGLTSALFIFGMLVPNLGLLRTATNDTPTALYTEASVENVPDFGSRASDDTLIEVRVDGNGRMVDYSLLQGQMNSDVGNFLLFTTYTPATVFLQPAAGRVFIRRARRSGIVVKG